MTTPSIGAMRYEMEKYVPVLLSFAIQVILFFAGRFHVHITDKFTRVLISSTYLGADIVAIYALGNLSRQEGNPQSIAFFWAPFLLIHLGGQDTISAFKMEDNNAWLTRSGKLLFYAGISVFVFFNSSGRHKELQLAGIFMFVTGFIKYYTRIWSLKCGSFESIENCSIRDMYKIKLPEASNGPNTTYYDSVLAALNSMLQIHDIFAARNLTSTAESESEDKETVESEEAVRSVREDEEAVEPEEAARSVDIDEEIVEPKEYKISIKDDEVVESKEDKISTEDDEAIQSTGNNTPIEGDEAVQLEGDETSIENRKAELEKIIVETILKPEISLVQIQLGMMYDDLYPKALLLRKREGIALRFIAISTSIVAFALFLSTEKRRYRKADIAVTMSLFIGELLLEVCTVLIFMMSPWTWAWLKVRKYNWLACFSWYLFSSRIGWPEDRPRWSNSMGQYNCVNRLVGISPPTSCTPKIMIHLRNIADKVGAKEISWINKLIHTGYVKADRETMERVVLDLYGLINEVDGQDTVHREWRYVGSFLEQIQDVLTADFGTALLMMHMVTEVFLRQYPGSHSLVDVCRKLSNYMIYLLVNHPSMLPLNTSAVSSIKTAEGMFRKETEDISDADHYKNIHDSLLVGDQPEGDGVLDELVEMWVRVLLYAAGKSRAELHVEQLASGGELITFAWLLMAQNDYGDSRMKRIQITNFSPHDDCYDLPVKEAHAFHIVHRSEVDIQRD
uniref:DUF4220 domain-containing protein n=1 Tax=Oryza punctata TaxID=4537 RepID=A0A0E0JI36_ORYPU